MAYKFQLGDARMSGSLTQEEGVTVDSGGLTVTAGGLTVSAGTTALAAVTATSVDGTGDLTMGTITMTGFTVDADGDTALKSLAVDDSSTIGCDSDTDLMTLSDGLLNVAGEVQMTTLDIGGTNVTATAAELNYLDIASLGTAAASKALVADGSAELDAGAITFTDLGTVTTVDINGGSVDGVVIGANSAAAGNFTSIDGSGDLTVATITMSEFTVAANGNTDVDGTLNVEGAVTLQAALNMDNASVTEAGIVSGALGAQFMSLEVGDSVVIDKTKAAKNLTSVSASGDLATGTITLAEFSVTRAGAMSGSSTLAVGDDSTFAGKLEPLVDDGYDLGSSTKEWKNLYLDGIAYVDELRADTLGAALDCNNQAMTNVDVDSGAIDGATIGANSAAAGTFTTLVGTSLSLTDGDITNVGDINCDSISVDDAAAGLNINFGGSSTGNNKLSLTDNLADALNITEAGNSYMKFTTTNGSELITFGKGLTAASQTWTDLGSVTTCDINGGSVDGATIGANSAAAGTFTTLVAGGNVDLGDATSDTITATGRFDSDLTPSSDSARNLGSSALRWSTIYVDSIVGADVAFDVETVAGGGTISAGTDFALISSGDGATVTLPDASAGKAVRVKLGNAVGDVILDGAAADTIDGNANVRLESTGSAVTLIAVDASTWYII